eukprot:scaffold145112_cov30-Tisochrysis_lutea.AAC.8
MVACEQLGRPPRCRARQQCAMLTRHTTPMPHAVLDTFAFPCCFVCCHDVWHAIIPSCIRGWILLGRRGGFRFHCRLSRVSAAR